MQNLYQLVTFNFFFSFDWIILFFVAQFQNLQKKKIEQVQRKALVQELEEKQLKRMRPAKPVSPRGSFAYGTSDDEVFYEQVRKIAKEIFFFCSYFLFFIKTQRTAPHRQPTAPTVSRPLKDSEVKEGQPIQLTCQVQGFPKSEVS